MVWISDDVVDHTPCFCNALVYGRDVFRSLSNEYSNFCLWSLLLEVCASVTGPLMVMILSVSSTVFGSASDVPKVASLPVIVEVVLDSLRESCCSNLAIRRDIS